MPWRLEAEGGRCTASGSSSGEESELVSTGEGGPENVGPEGGDPGVRGEWEAGAGDERPGEMGAGDERPGEMGACITG
jgi:hypothetical protein